GGLPGERRDGALNDRRDRRVAGGRAAVSEAGTVDGGGAAAQGRRAGEGGGGPDRREAGRVGEGREVGRDAGLPAEVQDRVGQGTGAGAQGDGDEGRVHRRRRLLRDAHRAGEADDHKRDPQGVRGGGRGGDRGGRRDRGGVRPGECTGGAEGVPGRPAVPVPDPRQQDQQRPVPRPLR